MDIEHKMSIVLDTRKFNFGSQWCLRFHIWLIMTLYYKMRHIITKCDSYFITKYDKSLLQNATVLGSYYKMLRLLQNASVQTL